MALSADLLGDRWMLLILREAFYGVRRYEDMLADLGAPRATLTDRLNRLVSHGLLVREPYQEPGSRTRQAYRLTTAGQALGTVLIALSEWGEGHLLASAAPVEFVEAKSGSALRLALVDEKCAEVPLEKVRIRLRER